MLVSTSPPRRRTRATNPLLNPPLDETARASGTAAKPAGRSPGAQVFPWSVLDARGEKSRAWLGSNPASDVMVPSASAFVLTTRPPLSATPVGVASTHREVADERKKSCQKVSSRSLSRPMGTTASSADPTAEVASRGTSIENGESTSVPPSPVPGLEQAPSTNAETTSAAAQPTRGVRALTLLTCGSHARARRPGTPRTTTKPTKSRRPGWH